LADIRQAIGENVLVEYVDFARSYRDPRALGGLFQENRVAAFVVAPEGDIQFIDLESSPVIAQKTDAWRAGFGNSTESREAGQFLRSAIWDKVAPHLGASGQVLIAPDGALCRLPLAALPGKTPGNYLLEERALALIPTPRIVVEAAQRGALPIKSNSPAGPPTVENLLVLGSVDYDANLAAAAQASDPPPARVFGLAPVDRGKEAGRFQFLPGSRGELATIRLLYEQHFGTGGLKVLEGAGATESAFRMEAPRHRYLHISTHGFFAPENIQSALSRHARDTSRFAEAFATRQSLAEYHPNLLSGLAVAGANKPLPTGDDGILTAEEIQALDLRRVELVVLSACETGLGERAGGEGLLGLQRSFHVAGAQTVIASLWKVDDVATRDLMERFYENLWSKTKEDGKTPLYTKLEALREAQLWMLKERGPRGATPVEADLKTAGERRLPPYYWAAFVLSGDWR
jgi:CHAT domain-containing protein